MLETRVTSVSEFVASGVSKPLRCGKYGINAASAGTITFANVAHPFTPPIEFEALNNVEVTFSVDVTITELPKCNCRK